MVQKRWSGLPLILGLLWLAGCSCLFASPKSMVALEREAEAVEEELADAQATDRERRAALARQLKEIKVVDRERRLFFGVLKEQTSALLDDMSLLFDELGGLARRLQTLSRGAKGSSDTLKATHRSHQIEWEKRIQQARGHICTVQPKERGCPK